MIKKTKKLNKKEIGKNYRAFPIISVCREDLVLVTEYEGIKKYPKKFIDSLTDDDMKNIAMEMSDILETNMDLYWESLHDACDSLLKDYKKNTNKK